MTILCVLLLVYGVWCFIKNKVWDYLLKTWTNWLSQLGESSLTLINKGAEYLEHDVFWPITEGDMNFNSLINELPDVQWDWEKALENFNQNNLEEELKEINDDLEESLESLGENSETFNQSLQDGLSEIGDNLNELFTFVPQTHSGALSTVWNAITYITPLDWMLLGGICIVGAVIWYYDLIPGNAPSGGSTSGLEEIHWKITNANLESLKQSQANLDRTSELMNRVVQANQQMPPTTNIPTPNPVVPSVCRVEDYYINSSLELVNSIPYLSYWLLGLAMLCIIILLSRFRLNESPLIIRQTLRKYQGNNWQIEIFTYYYPKKMKIFDQCQLPTPLKPIPETITLSPLAVKSPANYSTPVKVKVEDLVSKKTTVYNSLTEASLALNISISAVSRRLKQTNSKPYRKRYLIKKG